MFAGEGLFKCMDVDFYGTADFHGTDVAAEGFIACIGKGTVKVQGYLIPYPGNIAGQIC